MSAAPEGGRTADSSDAVCRSARLSVLPLRLPLFSFCPPNSSLIDTHFWRGFFFSQALGADLSDSVKPARPIRSREKEPDEAPRPMEAEESARPERGTVIRTAAQTGPTPECCLLEKIH